MSFELDIPTRVLFGPGQLDNLHEQELPGKKAMLVLTNGKSAKENGYLARTEEQLKRAGAQTALFDRVEPNPTKGTVMAGGEFARENDCDFIVALGGGSPMDAAKAIAVMATNGGDFWDYVQEGSGRGKPIENTPLPLVAITTTAGTGSEVDPVGVITNEAKNEKIGFGGLRELFPEIAVVDPELMLTVPPRLTAFQGFDALFHSVEGYISNQTNLLSDTYARTAIKNISENLPVAVENGNDLAARERVAFANTLSGLVMCVGGISSQHSLEHAMSAYHPDLPHGAGLIMLSEAYFKQLIEAGVAGERFVELADLLGYEQAGEPLDFITALNELREDCGVADLEMSDYGIGPEDFEKLAKNARATMGRLFECDRIDLTIEDCVAIYRDSYR